ncbi:MAG: hypothetical protein EG823_06965 [Actinobacteria bacterium]|nr:hypothetical protein [Actinomycetota bacterium]
MTAPTLRDAYLAWTRRAVPVLLLPLALTAAIQTAASSAWWAEGQTAESAVRYLFVAAAIASVMMGRGTRARDTAARPLAPVTVVSLSWRLVAFALAPAVIGAALALMTRQAVDFYLMLLVTLVGLALLYPRFDQWVAWSVAPEAE